jgi:hypothetical protein
MNELPGIGHNNPPDNTPVKIFQRYTSEQRASHAASHRLGHVQKHRVGEFFWYVPSIPDIAFATRKAALRAVVDRGLD